MKKRPSKCGASLEAAFAAIPLMATAPDANSVSPASGALRCVSQENAANENLAAPLSPLASARRDCPLSRRHDW